VAARQILWTGALALVVLLATACGACAQARAQLEPFATTVPVLAIDAVPSPSSDRTPLLEGSAGTGAGYAAAVTVTVSGPGGPYVALATVRAGSWSLTLPQLPEGSYTASVAQLYRGVSVQAEAIGFTVDFTAPALTIDAPAPESAESAGERIEGSAGVAGGDLPAVTVRVYAGSAIAPEQVPVESITVQSSAGAWAVTVAGLAPGAYTARAEQVDEAGNVALSASESFEVLAPAASSGVASASASAAPTPPGASFTWLPAKPHVDEAVSLLSTSQPGSSPLTEVQWALKPTGPFEIAGTAHQLTFEKPGQHLVRMRVIAADGLASTVTRQLTVLPRRPALMSPFPVVQFAGSYSSRGAHLEQLRVEVPLGARVTVSCLGRGCPISWERYRAAGGHGGLVPVLFRGFERALPAGVELRVTVFQPEEIGKLTRIYVRAGRPPRRVDSCVDPSGKRAVACPG